MRVKPEEWRVITCIDRESFQFDGRVQPVGGQAALDFRSVKDDANTNPEIVLRAVKQSRRVVVELDHPHVDSIIGADVDATTKRSREARFTFRKVRTRARKDLNTKDVIELHTIATMCSTNKRVCKRLEG